MAIEWADNILLANLADEPALSDELNMIVEQIDRADDPPHVVLDFHEVGYINSSNIAQLLRVRKLQESNARKLCLCAVPEEVWSILMITGLDKVFSTAPDMLTAMASIQIDENGA